MAQFKCSPLKHNFKVGKDGEVCLCGMTQLQRSPVLAEDGKTRLQVKLIDHSLNSVMSRAFEKAYNRPRRF